ncbi:hypothetical protein AABM38_05035 [Heyndrickxia sp. MSNUG]|uniref:hypothetical protein n=1 Tax=Heyndrickxia sp. MSNUG TaxID=3136677 RepID=UPI003C2E66D2
MKKGVTALTGDILLSTVEKSSPAGDILLSTVEKSSPTGEIITLAQTPCIYVAYAPLLIYFSIYVCLFCSFLSSFLIFFT